MQVLSQFHDLILCIISALEARDSYTSHHSSRVAEMTEKICELLELDEEEKEVYHIAAHLHDIGKIGIRDNVLLKSEKMKPIVVWLPGDKALSKQYRNCQSSLR